MVFDGMEVEVNHTLKFTTYQGLRAAEQVGRNTERIRRASFEAGSIHTLRKLTRPLQSGQ